MTWQRQAASALAALVMIVSMVAVVSFASVPAAAQPSDSDNSGNNYDPFAATKAGAGIGGSAGAAVGNFLDPTAGLGGQPLPEKPSSLGAKAGGKVGAGIGGAIGAGIDVFRAGANFGGLLGNAREGPPAGNGGQQSAVPEGFPGGPDAFCAAQGLDADDPQDDCP